MDWGESMGVVLAHATDPSPTTRHRLHGIEFESTALFPSWPRGSVAGSLGDPKWTLDVRSLEATEPELPAFDPEDLRGVWSLQGTPNDPDCMTYAVNLGDLSISNYVVDLRTRTVTADRLPRQPLARSGVEFVLACRVLPWLARVHRGALPLHAVAVSFEGRALLICGDSGTGKSTLAAKLLGMGCELLGDEPVVVDVAGDEVLAHHGSWRLRVNEGSPAHADLERQGFDLVENHGKTAAVRSRESAGAPVGVPVSAIVVLRERDPLATMPHLERCDGLGATRELMAHRYCLAGPVAVTGGDFATVAAVVARVPVVRVAMPASIDHLAAAATLLRDELLGG